MKKIAVFLLIVFVSLTFVGCTSASNLSSVNTAFSSIYFAIDCNEIVEELTQEEKDVLKNKVEALASKYAGQIKLRYLNLLNDLASGGKISSSQKVIYQNHLTPYVSWTDGTYVIEFRFYSNTASRLFIKSGEYSGAKNTEEFLATVTTESFKYVFSETPNNIIETSLEEYFKNGISASLSEKELDNLKFYYFFLTENLKLHAKNASQTLELSEGVLFCFNGQENSEELEFEFYVVQPNVFMYYLLALTIAFVFVAIYLVAAYFKKNKKLTMKNQQKTSDHSIEDFERDNKE